MIPTSIINLDISSLLIGKQLYVLNKEELCSIQYANISITK